MKDNFRISMTITVYVCTKIEKKIGRVNMVNRKSSHPIVMATP